ncbi:hypothetical protein GCM10010174_80870 [Kutzneria viridogrisea]|uniref:AAA+ ATPase domain-containing protein n=1 Tax=Kutzneria viridogrisea TaxID=47990 RepID=A0ABR6BZ20_9PSEU|nr:hypothetical protein [Kutzneria viridogrisea]
MAATAPAPDTTAEDGAVQATPDYTQRVTTLAEQLLREWERAQLRKAPVERRTSTELWRDARKEAASQVRRQIVAEKTKEFGRAVVTNVHAEVASVVHRNRRQLAPWLLAAPFAAVGEVANLATQYGNGQPIGLSALCAASATGASILAWRKKIAQRTPAKFAKKVKAGLGLGCAFTAGMPLVGGAGVWGMWLAALAGTAWLGLGWWREHDVPIPLSPELAGLEVADLADSTGAAGQHEPTVAQRAFAEQLVADWGTYVAGQGTLPGSTLSHPRHIEYGWTFWLHLVRGKQTIEDARTAKTKFAAALNLNANSVSIDHQKNGRDLSTVVLTVITSEVTNTYDGPRIIREGENIYIEIGPYQDGLGAERFHVLAGQLTAAQLAAGERPRGSMNGGFVLGTKGSGKSRLMEAIADGLRELGIVVCYLDPQCGKSSPALMAEADWPLSGVHGIGGAYSNVVDLWKAIKVVNELRSAEGAAAGDQGFQHTRQRPAIMVMIDECHGVFQAENPATGSSFGADFADLDREMRKNGIGLFGASQSITQDTFGTGNKAAVLRDGMCAVNVYLMSYGGKNLGLAPGYDGQPAAALPTNLGYGFNPKGERPHARWQARYTSDFQPWLAAKPKSVLDERAQKRIGDTYLKRFEKFDADLSAAQAWLDALDAHEGDASALPSFGQQSENTPASTPGRGGSVTTLLSPAQRRAQAAGVQTTAAPAPPPEPAEPSEVQQALTETEQRVLDILRTSPQSPTTLAAELAVSPQAAGRHLRNLAAKDQALKLPDGRYEVLD